MPDAERARPARLPRRAASSGNRVQRQFQLDVFGEALLLFAAAARAECLDTDGWHAAKIAGRRIADLWQRARRGHLGDSSRGRGPTAG